MRSARNYFRTIRNSRSLSRDERGFATAQWVMIVAFTIFIFATFTNILLIENVRATTIASLRDAAKAGTREVDLKRAVDSGNQSTAVNACLTRLQANINDLNGADTSTAQCVIRQDARGHFYMEATLIVDPTLLVPWASPFGTRLGELSATYVPTEAAR